VTEILTQLLNGLVVGMTLALLAVGLSIIFGMLRVVNFSHGALYMLGPYVALVVIKAVGNFWLGLVAGTIVVSIIGMALELLGVRPLYGKGEILPLLLTFGASMILTESVLAIFGPLGTTIGQPQILSGQLNLGFIAYPKFRLFLILFTVALTTTLWLFITKTRLGLLIRAGTQDTVMARALGVRVKPLFTLVFGIGAAMAAIAGVMSAAMQGVEPYMGMKVLIPAFVVVTVGGLGSFRGSIIAGLLIGEAKCISILVWPPISDVIMFIFMALVLLLKPEGLFKGT
jgi:branched-chain amino acid transport system permease protein